MPALTQQEIWKFQFVTYFITQHRYRLVNVKQLANEVWLVNPEKVDYPLIRVTVKSMDSDVFNQDRTNEIHQTILNVFKRTGRRLELYVYAMPQERKVDGNMLMNVYPGAVFSEELRVLFPGVETVCHNVSDLAMEYTSLNKQVEAFNKQEFKKERKKHSLWRKENFPYITLAIGILCVINYLLGLYLSTVTDDSVARAIVQGAYYKAFVVGLNEWWRLMSSGFVHFDIFHLVMNMMALYYMGAMIERVYGKWKYLVIMLVSILFGNIFVFIGDANVVCGGLSGGLYGLLAATMVYFIENGQMRVPAIRNQFIYMIGVNIMISFVANVSWLGHLGGFVGGVFVAMICTKKPEWKFWRINFAAALALLTIGLGVMIPRSMKLDDIYMGTDKEVITIAQKVGANWYADHVSDIYIYYTKR